MIFNDRTGEIKVMNCGYEAKIVAYRGTNDIDVIFTKNNELVTNRSYTNFKAGSILPLFLPTLLGVGYTGECSSITINGGRPRSYFIWAGMIDRCYNEKSLIKKPTYLGCSVCEEWHNYSNFKKWYDENYYTIEGVQIHLDKDLIKKGNKVYSPDMCVFAPQRINSIIVKSDSIRGECPIGVYKYKNKYYSEVNTGGSKKIRCGCFDSPEEAFMRYKKVKEQYIKQVADEYKDRIPQRLYKALYDYEVEITD